MVSYVITGPEVYCAQTSEVHGQKVPSRQSLNTVLNSLSRRLALELTFTQNYVKTAIFASIIVNIVGNVLSQGCQTHFRLRAGWEKMEQCVGWIFFLLNQWADSYILQY